MGYRLQIKHFKSISFYFIHILILILYFGVSKYIISLHVLRSEIFLKDGGVVLLVTKDNGDFQIDRKTGRC